MKTLALSLILAGALAACGTDSKPCDPEAPNTICTIAGSSTNFGYKGDNGPATKAILYYPLDSIIGPDGNVWFIDFNNYVVREIDPMGDIHTIVGNGHLGDSPASDGVNEIAARQAANNHTTGLFVANNYLYLAAWHESRVKRVDLSNMMMENYAGDASREKYSGDGGPAMNAQIDLPSSIALDPAGDIVIMDQGNQVVRKIDSTGTISTIVGQCVVEVTPCSASNQPVACSTNERYVCGDPTVGCAQRCTPGYGGDGGPASLARLNLPYSQAADPAGRITYDKQGNLLISDTGNNRIRKVDMTTNTITTIAGTGTAGYSGDGGPAAAAELNHPVDLAVADDGTIYFTDVYNNCIRKIDPSGTISAVAGKCKYTPDGGTKGVFSGDGGAPLEATLFKPYGIDLVGNKLYVSDTYNNRLRVVNLP